MAFLTSASRRDDEETKSGGPIGALLIAIPISLVLWGGVMLVILQIVR